MTLILGPGGRIVFLSATTQYTGAPMQAHAAVAKAGIDALSASVAIEMGPRGITSNVIAPGPINCTEGLERLVTDPDNPTHTKGVPVGRFGTVRDLADAIVYLFSDAGSYVNGEIMVG
jgi:peroxisomal 2,4-dienoyl-CoA reductase